MWYAQHRDALRLDRALEACRPRCEDLFQPGVPGYGVQRRHWYPAEAVHGLLDELLEGVSDSEMRRMAEPAAQSIMRANLTGVYQFAFSVIATPERFATHAQRLWGVHYASGELVYTATDERSYDIHYRGWRGHHRAICWLNMASAIPIFEFMGCEGVSWDRHACVSDGHDECRSSVTWQGGRSPRGVR